MAEDMVRPRFKRRQYIVAREFQVKYAGLILLLMFVTAGFCSYAIYYTTMILFGEKLASVYPQGQLVSIVNTVNFRIFLSMILISPLVGAFGIYLSHKIAGPIYRIEKFLSAMCAGDLTTRITLRKGDELIALADAINRLVGSLGSSLTIEKTHMENTLKELNDLRNEISSLPGKHPQVLKTIDRLDDEIRLIGKELDRYKV